MCVCVCIHIIMLIMMCLLCVLHIAANEQLYVVTYNAHNNVR